MMGTKRKERKKICDNLEKLFHCNLCRNDRNILLIIISINMNLVKYKNIKKYNIL